MGAQGRWIQSSHLMECKSKRQQDPGITSCISHALCMVAKCRCTSDDTLVTQGEGAIICMHNWTIAPEKLEGGEIIVRIIQSLFEVVHEKKNLFYFNMLPPLQTMGSWLLYFEVKCNYPPLGMKASSDPEVEVSQLDVDQAHQPQGGLCRLQPLCAAEYSCPLQYPRVVSVYPAMLIAEHRRSECKTRMDASLMLKCLLWNVYFKVVYLWHRAPNVAQIECLAT